MNAATDNRYAGWHWLIIETGGNQAFIFSTNKQIAHVGASELITRVGRIWVPEAIKKTLDEVEEVVLASGKAQLLVQKPETGKEIIEKVTRKALDEAPGLEIWGVVDPKPVGDNIAGALTRASSLHAAWRSRRPATTLRRPTLPFTQLCRYSGQPATHEGKEGDQRHPQSTIIHTAWENGQKARKTIVTTLQKTSDNPEIIDKAIVRPTRLNDGVTHNGWVAVLHADGNGIGEIFRNLCTKYTGDEYLQRLRDFSKALDEVTRSAFASALASTAQKPGVGEDWMLPLVLGGDDVTVLMNARVAYDFTVGFLREFAAHSTTNNVTTEITGGAGLTACAGLAYIKPHHSFAEAYDLAEALCSSAKYVKKKATGCGALDFHVLHDSVGTNLTKIRSHLTIKGKNPDVVSRLWAGPIVVPAQGQPVEGWAAYRTHTLFEEAIEGINPSDGSTALLSRTRVHQLREALFHGTDAVERTRRRIEQWADPSDREKVKSYIDKHLLIADADADVDADTDADKSSSQFSRLISALDVVDVTAGTSENTNIAGGQ